MKICVICGHEFEKPRKVDAEQWRAARCCSHKCASVYRGKKALYTRTKRPIEEVKAELRDAFARAGVPYGYCCCGCGDRTRPAKQTTTRLGMVNGEPQRFVNGHQARKLNHVPKHLHDSNRQMIMGGAARHGRARTGVLATPAIG